MRGRYKPSNAVCSVDLASEIRRDVFDQLRVPDQSAPSSNGFVADLTAHDFGTLRFEILRRVPETLILDHRVYRPESRDARSRQARLNPTPLLRRGGQRCQWIRKRQIFEPVFNPLVHRGG